MVSLFTFIKATPSKHPISCLTLRNPPLRSDEIYHVAIETCSSSPIRCISTFQPSPQPSTVRVISGQLSLSVKSSVITVSLDIYLYNNQHQEDQNIRKVSAGINFKVEKILRLNFGLFLHKKLTFFMFFL